jgi:hypothetical protein
MSVITKSIDRASSLCLQQTEREFTTSPILGLSLPEYLRISASVFENKITESPIRGLSIPEYERLFLMNDN